MTYYSDLSVCDYFNVDHGGILLAIGWLDSGHWFKTGRTDKGSYDLLADAFIDPWQPFSTCGSHVCNICQYGGPRGHRNLFIPHSNSIIVVPELILHYIACHHYQPPDILFDALSVVSDSRTMKYKRMLLENGGSFLLREQSN